MLLTHEEMRFDFQGAKFDIVKDKELLAWMFNQFLYGEVTGIQCGHWIYNAPDLDAARFLARQATEEFQHVDNFVQCLHYIGAKPEKPHRVVQFLTTGMMPESWAEHVSLEMAQGEGFVLMAFYALIDTVDQPQIHAILSRAVKQEERHVQFGEERTMALIKNDEGLRLRLFGLNLVSLLGVEQLAKFLKKQPQFSSAEHPVMRHIDLFLQKVVATGELRMLRMGLIDKPLAQFSQWEKQRCIVAAYAHKAMHTLWRIPSKLFPFSYEQRLTDTYLGDQSIRNTLHRLQQEQNESATVHVEENR